MVEIDSKSQNMSKKESKYVQKTAVNLEHY